MARREWALLALVLLLSAFSVALFAFLTPEGRAPDEYRYRDEIRRFVETGELSAGASGHPPLYTLVASVPYRLGRTARERELLVRLLGLLFMPVTVLATFGVSSELFPRRDLGKWAPPLLVALLPQLAFMNGAINSDGLLAALCAVFTYLCVRLLRRPPSALVIASLGVVSVLGWYAKQRFLVVLLLLVPVLLVSAARRTRGRGASWMRAAIVVACVAGVIASLVGLRAFVAVIPPLDVPRAQALAASFQRIPADINGNYLALLFESFWGYFDWCALPMHAGAYLVFAGLSVLALAGNAVTAVRRVRKLGVRRAFFDADAVTWWFFAGLLTLSVVAIVAYELFWWGTQGRYAFNALVPIALFAGLGFSALVPRRMSLPALQALALLLVGTMFVEIVFRVIPYYY